VYAPALVAFVGINSPSIGWYPLAPGEIWQPYWNASPVYVRNVNRYLVADSRSYNTGAHVFSRRPDAITTVRVDDFSRGRPVQSRWSRIHAQDLARVQPTAPPVPLREARRDFPREQARIIQREQREQLREQRQPMPPREIAPRPQPNWRGGEEGGYSRFQPREPQRQQFVQQQPQRQQFVQQQQQREVQREQREVQRVQRVEAVRQQQAAREAQRQQFVQQQQQQRAYAVQPHPQRAAPAAQQQQRREERAAQREAQRGEEGHGHGRRYE
jgi:hypothetical protein